MLQLDPPNLLHQPWRPQKTAHFCPIFRRNNVKILVIAVAQNALCVLQIDQPFWSGAYYVNTPKFTFHSIFTGAMLCRNEPKTAGNAATATPFLPA